MATVLFYVVFLAGMVLIPSLALFALLQILHALHLEWGTVAQRLSPSPRGTLALRFPAFTRQLRARLNPHSPWGLALTLSLIVMVLGALATVDVLHSLSTETSFQATDVRIHTTVALFRTPLATRFFLVLTELGGPVFLTFFCLCLAAFFIASRQRRQGWSLLLALAGSAILSTILKALIHHARPLDPLIVAHEASFPSGHTLSAATVYGLLAFHLLTSQPRRWWHILGAGALIVLIALIGISRVYLGVHWPSDVLGSLGLAAAWLAVVIFITHYPRRIPLLDTFPKRIPVRLLLGAGILFGLAATAAIAFLPAHTALLVTPAAPTPTAISETELDSKYPANTASENVVGGTVEPVSIFLVGTPAELQLVFAHTGWTMTEAPSPSALAVATRETLLGGAKENAAAPPTYLFDRPQSLSFRRDGVLLRIWPSAYCLGNPCRPLELATLGQDDEGWTRLFGEEESKPLLRPDVVTLLPGLADAGAKVLPIATRVLIFAPH